jgi:hypothetical protein
VESLSERLPIEEQAGWTLVDIMSEPDGYEGPSYINFNHGLLEIAVDSEQECSGWLLLVEHLEIVGMLSQAAKYRV